MIKLMVDSASDCRKREMYDYFVPIKVNIDGTEYLDGINLDNDTFYELLEKSDDFPKTSQPTPDDFIKVFEKVMEDGDSLVYFSMSSALSGTYQSACIAKSMLGYDGIYIIDTLSVTHAISFLVLHAKKLINEGKTAEEIVEECEKLKFKIRVFAGAETLEYLKKGGRIGKAAALVGTVANIKPVISVTEEGVDTLGKSLGVGKAIGLISEKVKEVGVNPDFPIISVYTKGHENTQKLEEKLRQNGFNVSDTQQIGPTIGAHIGPGVYGVCFIAK